MYVSLLTIDEHGFLTSGIIIHNNIIIINFTIMSITCKWTGHIYNIYMYSTYSKSHYVNIQLNTIAFTGTIWSVRSVKLLYNHVSTINSITVEQTKPQK